MHVHAGGACLSFAASSLTHRAEPSRGTRLKSGLQQRAMLRAFAKRRPLVAASLVSSSLRRLQVRKSSGAVRETLHGRTRIVQPSASQPDKLESHWTNGDKDGPPTAVATTASGRPRSVRTRLRLALFDPLVAHTRHLLLPLGYPGSVSACYTSFSLWQAAECVFAAMTDVFCTQAMLTSVGIAASGATALAVGVQWILKDGIASLVKMWFVKRYSNLFDVKPRTLKVIGEGLVTVGRRALVLCFAVWLLCRCAAWLLASASGRLLCLRTPSHSLGGSTHRFPLRLRFACCRPRAAAVHAGVSALFLATGVARLVPFPPVHTIHAVAIPWLGVIVAVIVACWWQAPCSNRCRTFAGARR
jgi:hypothetical protein